MEVDLELGKSVAENAAAYFEKAKKVRKKLLGLERALRVTEQKKAVLEAQGTTVGAAPNAKKVMRAWFEEFHWFYSSDGFLVVGGKNAQSNEQLVKKHLSEGDLFLHADIQGGSGCILIAQGQEIREKTKQEAAVFAATFSKAWKQGLPGVDVYAVEKNQVSKHAPSGEALGTGAFMIRGKREWFRNTPLDCCIGVKLQNNHAQIISGPASAIQPVARVCAKIVQGKQDANTVAKQLVKLFKKKLPAQTILSVDAITKMLPGEGMELSLT